MKCITFLTKFDVKINKKIVVIERVFNVENNIMIKSIIKKIKLTRLSDLKSFEALNEIEKVLKKK